MVSDFSKRLKNALNDAGLNNSNVPSYLDYLKRLVEYFKDEDSCQLQGATAVYVIQK